MSYKFIYLVIILCLVSFSVFFISNKTQAQTECPQNAACIPISSSATVKLVCPNGKVCFSFSDNPCPMGNTCPLTEKIRAVCPTGYNCYHVLDSNWSDAPFTISVVSPSEGSVLTTGTQTEIRWQTTNLSSDQKLEIALNGYGVIAESVPNTGSYLWTVKGPVPFFSTEIQKTVSPKNSFQIYIACPISFYSCRYSHNAGYSGTFSIASPSVQNSSIDNAVQQTKNSKEISQVIVKTLMYGSRDPQVLILQKFLISQSYLKPENATGYFGPITLAAVKKFQSNNNIIQTGIVGPLTRAKINF